ncbi:hypothetical protein HK096_006618, partial [Nowakowskiella sp. JEL0078]
MPRYQPATDQSDSNPEILTNSIQSMNFTRTSATNDKFPTLPEPIIKSNSKTKQWNKKDFWNISVVESHIFSKDLLQGVPLGLTFGSIPFLLKAKLSYADIALFSLSGYPYSLKLLWSPIVDSLYLKSVGRRKSWI